MFKEHLKMIFGGGATLAATFIVAEEMHPHFRRVTDALKAGTKSVTLRAMRSMDARKRVRRLRQ